MIVPMFFLFELIVLIFSVIIHEISHGYVAERLGDPTARLAGRLTLNPLKHIDPVGSVILPLLLAIPALFGQPTIIFGWAKPVPYNPAYLKDPKRGAGAIAAAGPLSNFLLAAVFGVLLRSISYNPPSLALFFSVIILINIALGVFNLLPLPPLDGSKVLFAFLPPTEKSFRLMRFLERNGFLLIIFFVFFGYELIIPVLSALYLLFAGQPF